MSKIYVDEIAGIASADTVAIPGHVIQVVQTVETAVVSQALTSPNFGPALMATSITPTSTSSKILIDVTIHCVRDGSFAFGYFGIFKNNSIIEDARGDASGSRPRTAGGLHLNGTVGAADIGSNSLKFLDDPNTTSELTYDIRLLATGDATYSLNRTRSDNNDNGGVRTISTLTLMEIAG